MRLKWQLETLAQGEWFKLTCNPYPRMERLSDRVEEALRTFEDVATGDYMVHITDASYCYVIAVQNEIDAVSMQLLLPSSGCYRGRVKLRREQRMAIKRRAG